MPATATTVTLAAQLSGSDPCLVGRKVTFENYNTDGVETGTTGLYTATISASLLSSPTPMTVTVAETLSCAPASDTTAGPPPPARQGRGRAPRPPRLSLDPPG